MTPATVRRRVLVSGLVQGVFFRDSCRREADSHGVAGWARNRSDGTVEVAFEGPPDEVEAMVAWARRGPPHARVEHVEVTDEAPQGLHGFDVG